MLHRRWRVVDSLDMVPADSTSIELDLKRYDGFAHRQQVIEERFFERYKYLHVGITARRTVRKLEKKRKVRANITDRLGYAASPGSDDGPGEVGKIG